VTESADLTEAEREALDHLRGEYAGVFTSAAIEAHLETHVGLSEAEELLVFLKSRRPDATKVLDVGSGYGSFVLVAREAGLDAVGIEPAQFEVKWARRRMVALHREIDPERTYLLGDGRALPFANDSFDAICFWNVLEHVNDVQAVLTEAARVLHRGGSVFVIAPNYAALRREAHYHVLWPPLLPRPLAVRYLRARGRDSGFYERSVYPCTMAGVVRALKRAGLVVNDPRLRRLDDPQSFRQPLVARTLGLLTRFGMSGVVRTALRLQLQNPLAPTIVLEAMKQAGDVST
jgi:SAM-dependent methyltransferase